MLSWASAHWFDLLQTVGIVAGLLFTAHATLRDERARRIQNLISMNERYSKVWGELYERPELMRVLKRDVNLIKEPVSDTERLFVKMLILNLDTVRQATKAGMFVKIQALQKDVQEFFSLPIPKAVWEKIKPFQNEDFVRFIEASLK